MNTKLFTPAAARRLPARPALTVLLTVLSLGLWCRGARAAIDQVNHQSWGDIVTATGNGWMHFPRAIGFDIDNGGTTGKKILVNWQTNDDVIQFPMTHGYAGSANAGATWASPSPITTTSPDLDLMASIRLKNGTVLAIPYYPNSSPSGASFTFSYQTSADNGVTWTNHANAGTVSAGGNTFGGFRFHRGLIEEDNGDLFAAAYCSFANLGDTSHRATIFKSTDGGVNWTYLSTIQYTAGLDYTETTIARCKNGDFYAVMRNASGSTYNDLKCRRSTDKGATWAGATGLVSGLPTPNAGVDPSLVLLPNGVLVLTYGVHRGSAGRDIHMAFSEDGNGASFSNDVTTFTGDEGVLESTGYTSVVPITGHRFMQIGDTGAPAYYATKHPSPNPFKIRSKVVDLVLTQKNRIDLAAKYSAGAITVTTDLTYADSAHPEARVTGAFDGSVSYWSGAFKSATSGTYTIDLQQNTTLNALGICLQYNHAESATISYSTDGSSWTPAKTYTNAVHNAIDYTTLGTPITARYVQVALTSTSSPVSLNEIELYSTADTFENYAANVGPFGYSVPAGGVWVSEGVTPLPTGYQSKRALYLNDSNSGANITVSKTTTAATSKTLEFRLRPKAYASGGSIQWRMLSGSTNAFRVAVFSDGSVKWWNGSTWGATTGTGSPAGAGTVALDSWSLIKLVASASTGTGTIYVNGVLKGMVGKESTVASLNGFLFGSSGTSAVGDQALFDDISFQ